VEIKDGEGAVKKFKNTLKSVSPKDFSGVIRTLRNEIEDLRGEEDPFREWRRSYESFAKQVKGSKEAPALLKELDKATRQQITLNLVTEAQVGILKQVAEAQAEQAEAGDSALQTRLNTWRELGFTSDQAMTDLARVLQDYEAELVKAGHTETEVAEMVHRRREEMTKPIDVQELVTWQDGMNSALENYVKHAGNAAENTQRLFANAFSSMENGLVNFVMTGKMDFESLVNSIIEDLARLAIRQAILAPILGAFMPTATIPTQTGGATGAMYGTFHTGGIAGEPSVQRMVDSAAFSQAERYHTGGIVAGEVPAILQRGEGVFTQAQMKALAPASSAPKVTVNVVNNTSSEVKITQQQGNNGEVKIMAQIDEAMAYAASRPSSQFSQATRGNNRLRMR
jgi:lambda family phage tail tape measure protein